MTKGDQGKTLSGHIVVFESLKDIPGCSNPLEGYIQNLYPGVDWSKQSWTLMGKVNLNGPDTTLDLDWGYYVAIK